jgi:hypothetical protein
MAKSIDDLKPSQLVPKPPPLTGAERVSRWRRRHGYRMLTIMMSAETAAAFLYLRKQWGFKTHHEMVTVALRYLAKKTREGETKLVLDID